MAVAWIPAMSANAQPQGGPRPEFKGEHRPMPTVNEIAQQKTNAMDHELTLTEKQYKKILKYYKEEAEKEREMMEDFPGEKPDFGGGRPPMGGPGMGGPGMGGGFRGPQGGFPGGGPGMGGGRPPMGGPAMGMSDEEMEKYYEKQDKKLKKILTPEQYDRWRRKHPAGHLPMPECELK